MSPFAASLRREWRLLRSRPRDWAMVSWVPLLAMALRCWIFSAGQPQRLLQAVPEQIAIRQLRQGVEVGQFPVLLLA